MFLILACASFRAFALSNSSNSPLFPSIITDVPGRPKSTHFVAQVSAAAGQAAGTWEDVYVFESIAKNSTNNNNGGMATNGYFSHLNGWTSSWVSSQIETKNGENSKLMLRIKRAGGGPAFRYAAIHPENAGVQQIENAGGDTGWMTFSTTGNAQVVIDFDGTMDETDTGPSYAGPPIHTFCWFVDDSLPVSALPDPADKDTIVIRPSDGGGLARANETALDPTRWQTVVFAPGVHRAATSSPNNFTVITQAPMTRYFFCAGAVVHAAFVGGKGKWGQKSFVIEGYGALSGEEMTRPQGANTSPQGITWSGTVNSTLSGVTLIDFPNHHIIVGQSSTYNHMHHVKVMGWRANGDGLHVFGNWHVSDLFMRTQDDSMYLSTGAGKSTTFERISTWNDANGCAFIFSAGGGDLEYSQLLNSTAIYARASWAYWSGGRIFGLRNVNTGMVQGGAMVDGVTCEDPLPSLNAWRFDATCKHGPGTCENCGFANLTFRNVHIKNFSTVHKAVHGVSPALLPHGQPNTMLTDVDSAKKNVTIHDIRFEKCTIAGQDLAVTFRDEMYSWNVSHDKSVYAITVDGKPVV